MIRRVNAALFGSAVSRLSIALVACVPSRLHARAGGVVNSGVRSSILTMVYGHMNH